MTMTDPIADMLTRLRNGNQAYHDTVSHAVLQAQGAASPRSSSRRATSRDWQVEEPRRVRSARRSRSTLKYGPNRERSIAGIRRDQQARPPRLREVDRPAQGARRTRRRHHLHLQGLLTDRQANQKGVGGEVLAYVW